MTGLGSPNFKIIAQTMLGSSASSTAFPYLGAAGRTAEDSDRAGDSGAHMVAAALGLSIAALVVSALCLLVVAYSHSHSCAQTSRPLNNDSSHNNNSSHSILEENQQGVQQQQQQQASVNPLRSSSDKYGYAKI